MTLDVALHVTGFQFPCLSNWIEGGGGFGLDMFCTASNFSNSESFYFHGSNLSKIAIRKMSKRKNRMLGVNWGVGLEGQAPWHRVTGRKLLG